MSEEEVCQKFPKYPLWLTGDEKPTMKQLEKFAAQTFTPLGYFFLNEPPEERLPIPDFRTLKDRRLARPSPHLLDTIHAALLRQDWMKGFLIEQGEPALGFIGSRTLSDQPEEVAEEMRRTLALEGHWSRALPTWEEALRLLIKKIEGIGVLVMINGVVENNTHRPLDIEEFRGFVLSDSHAPVIFLNGTDAKAAQMFTLVHELAHLWLGKGGVSDFQELIPSDNAVEIFCNQVAAEFLVPAHEMQTAWKEVKNNPKPFERLARFFKVSPVVVARRLLDLKLITREAYFSFYNSYQEAAAERRNQGAGGGNFYLTLGSRLGYRFPAAVYGAAREGRLQYREAYQLTGLSGSSYDRFGKELGFTI
ncbi:ImmA/IrrE family metallo-endopeptidase [Prosthecobacter sp. SYSU 5D2]|uniref:ImmA/IrrE family metallo-endopeptidase n=1 Tax=Prosthecobacter sp. SYSU 5D2 TaxID=3134134 RepID=UPI0031FE49A8